MATPLIESYRLHLEGSLFVLIALALFIWRLSVRPRSNRALMTKLDTLSAPERKSLYGQLAIIVPARNEAQNLPGLLRSLQKAHQEGTKIIVVDDHSTDATAAIAREWNVDVVSSKPRPEGWSGKNWACHQGAEALRASAFEGQYLLFTDADTHHYAEDIPKALAWFKTHGAAVMTCRPYHRNPTWWERMLGPFALLVLTITDAGRCRPKADRFFSIGQYLLFDRHYYEKSGGHESIQAALAEDLALARICFDQKQTFLVYPQTNLYSTRMYSSPSEFFKGWRRNFRLGMDQSTFLTFLETVLIISAGLGSLRLSNYAFTALLLALLQRRQGRFSFWGAILYPANYLLFIIISSCAQFDSLMNRPVEWKSRQYSFDKQNLSKR